MATRERASVPTYRLADPCEDELVARILYNAFLHNWDINWWQNLESHIPPVDAAPSPQESLTSAQQHRLEFYRAIVRLVRIIGGFISVAIPPDGNEPAAMLCWLPPKVEVTAYAVLRSGFLYALLRLGRLLGTLHFLYFEWKLSSLYDRCLKPIGFTGRSEGAFVQIIGTDPSHAGKGLSAGLLRWQIERHRQECLANGKFTPVFLDTAGEYQQKVYERMGFQALGKQKLRVSVDDGGLKGAVEAPRDFFLSVMMLDMRE
ncbi:hypothetical protein PRZ48_013464 [Zasmidium cellare]|uniref:N-acetyltransferase domain-containing protein n=1 Tax=Zasmidium cellare TaxID=395010 RepID=A0ABR0E155_ZASCE|nr:hypothetical protein PRZ48_013464 [Zasmidium cellare]